MLKSILNATGIFQNLERIKSELNLEANVQLNAAKTIGGQVAILSIWVVVTGIVGLFAVILAICLIYAWLAPMLGAPTTLAILFSIFALIFLICLTTARTKSAQIPARPPLKFPPILDPSPPAAAHETRPDMSLHMAHAAPRSSTIDDPLFNWLFQLARDSAPSGNTGSPQIDQLLTTLRPKAEEVASEAMTIAVEKVRHGDRKTMVAILGAATFLGWLVSRQGPTR